MTTTHHPLAGQTVPPRQLVNLPRLISAYYTGRVDPNDKRQCVSFGTSGHRGSSFDTSFNESHILAISQAICLYRQRQGITGPLFLGKDSHALSEPAFRSAIEVFAANGVITMIDADDGFTPTPVISHAILRYNQGRTTGWADGVVITPSHNPPEDGGFKYNPPNGGPADSDITSWIESVANDLISRNLADVRRIPFDSARRTDVIRRHDYVTPYVDDLAAVVDLALVARSGVSIGIEPLGGAALAFWQPIIERYKLNATLLSDRADPTFSFMALDWDGKVRMDCSSAFAMAPLIAMRDRFDVAFANDTDADRHGIVCRSAGLMNPNHYLTAAIAYLFDHRPAWSQSCAIGKTLVSSSSIDRLALKLGRPLIEVPVGFKWFVDGLQTGVIGFGGEESAGASFLRRDGQVWTTDKDGLILGLLAAEMTAATGKDPGQLYQDLTAELGEPLYARIDAPATPDQKAVFKTLSPASLGVDRIAGEAILDVLTHAPGNGQPFGGLKVTSKNGWFAVRPSGTENVYKIYAESFRDAGHLAALQEDAQRLMSDLFARAGHR